jgi:adenylate cyclase
MIVFCEECGERNNIAPDTVKGGPSRCQSCNSILRYTAPTLYPSEAGSSRVAYSQMELRLGDRVIEISQTRPSVTMGRQEHNDLEVVDTRVSRSHARIEYRNGKFMVIDHSTNGTYVQMQGIDGVNLKQEEQELKGSGIISLGRKLPPESPKAIHFVIKA